MTDQRNRMTTDPGLGPNIEPEHRSTLRSIVAADPVANDLSAEEEKSPGASVYYAPKPLHPVSEHKTLELETVKLAKDIDPRKLPTELRLRRPVLHVMPASEPNWPAPPQQPEVGWPPPQFDSGWPPPETVLTSSQRPQAARRRSFIPLAFLFLLGASLLLVLGAYTRRRSAAPGATAQAARAVSVAVPAALTKVEVPLRTPPASSESALLAGASAPVAARAGSASNAVAAAATAEPAASAAPARLADAPHRSAVKPPPSSSSSPSADDSPTLSAPPTTKPKRAIY